MRNLGVNKLCGPVSNERFTLIKPHLRPLYSQLLKTTNEQNVAQQTSIRQQFIFVHNSSK